MIIKRVFDLSLSAFGIILLAPIIALIGLIIFVFSGPPVFFCQERVGRYGKNLKLVKFRTMINDAENKQEGSVTIAGDARITLIGKYLRQYKLDELPSLWSVLKGDMSFVGPRPDVPGYADRLEGESCRILELRPGITGPATLKYANEEKILADVIDPKKYNDEVIFPDKIKINLEYLDNWNILTDIKIILKTIFRNNY